MSVHEPPHPSKLIGEFAKLQTHDRTVSGSAVQGRSDSQPKRIDHRSPQVTFATQKGFYRQSRASQNCRPPSAGSVFHRTKFSHQSGQAKADRASHCHNARAYFPDHPCGRTVPDVNGNPEEVARFNQNIQTNFHAMVVKTADLEAANDRLTAENVRLSSEKEVLKFRLVQSEERNFRLQEEFDALKAQLGAEKSLNESLNRQQVAAKLTEKNQGFLELENQHLRRDNLKLFQLLKLTKEFRNLAEFTDENHCLRSVNRLDGTRHWLAPEGGAVRSDVYRNEPSELGGGGVFNGNLAQPTSGKEAKPRKRAQSSKKGTQGDWDKYGKATQFKVYPKTALDENTDLFYWAPEKAFTFLRSLNQREQVSIPEALVDYIILELNRIWRHRELYIIDRCSTFCKNCKSGIFVHKNKLLADCLNKEEAVKHITKLEGDLARTTGRLNGAQKLAQKYENGLFTVGQNNHLATNLRNMGSAEFRQLLHRA